MTGFVLGVTGASGYIGQALVSRARQQGWRVCSLGRTQVEGVDEHRHAELSVTPSAALLDGLDAVVHLAAKTSGGAVTPLQETEFARALASFAADRGIPFLLVSSQTAASDAPSEYGRTKAAIEAKVLPLRAIVVRPGLVIGGREAGLFGMLAAIARALPVLPDFRPVCRVQPVHVDDLAAALLSALRTPAMQGRVIAVAGPAVAFGDFLQMLARYRARKRRWKIPVPLWLVRGSLMIGERVFGPRLAPARLDSLTQLPPLDATADLAELGICLRNLPDALGICGTPVRRLLLEGQALGRAVLTDDPQRWMLRRYVRLLRQLGQSSAMSLPASVLDSSWKLSALDAPSHRQGDQRDGLPWRMAVISRLLEAEPAHADAFLAMPGRAGRFRAVAAFLRAAALEAIVRVSGWMPWRNKLGGRELGR